LGAALLDALERGLARLPRSVALPLGLCLGILLGAARAFEAKRLHRDAAFLAYFGLLSLIPFLSLLVWVTGALAAPVIADPARRDQLRESILGATEHVFPFLADQLTGFLSEVAATSGAGGILGLVAMFVTAGLLFRALSVSISEVYDQERPRGFLGARVVAAISILAAGVVTLGLLLLREALAGLMEGYGIQWYLPLGPEATLVTVVEILVVVIGFVVTVRVSTRGRMRNRPLLVSGALFWLSWALAIKLFGLYLERVPTLSRVYGSLTAVAALLVWTYYTSAMFLFCVCVAREIGKIGEAGESEAG
jgi:YihY family inner membrane protein